MEGETGMRVTYFLIILLLTLASISSVEVALGCTGIRLKAEDGTPIQARTLDFGKSLESSLIIIPREQSYTGLTPNGEEEGLRWKSRYGIVGMSLYDYPYVIDGINEAGLAVGGFYLPGYTQYQPFEKDQKFKTLSSIQLPVYLLGTSQTIDDVLTVLKNIRVVSVPLKELENTPPPLHYFVTDATGRSIVIEYVHGELKTYENSLGVIANAPNFDWHLTNLSNYVNLSVLNVPEVKVGGIAFFALGQGSGMHGLPGDFTSPSRFIRAVAISQGVTATKNGPDAVLMAFRILNNFDIPQGVVRDKEGSEMHIDYTQWVSAADLKNKRYYYRTYENPQLHSIELKNIDFLAKQIVRIPFEQSDQIIPIQ